MYAEVNVCVLWKEGYYTCPFVKIFLSSAEDFFKLLKWKDKVWHFVKALQKADIMSKLFRVVTSH